ncbi:MAG: DUF1993 domain-containing protein [Oscillatoriales cyanobacterium SM2_2_1]|nr:DUF1993 domain-containing protein [Oscillatoriales cyanobacterium SM2_2_1]
MSLSMYQAAVPPLVCTLENLAHILSKGSAHATEQKIDPAVLLQSRLYPDMFSLTRQVQIACDIARRGVARLADTEAPAVEDHETTFEELVTRVHTTVSYIKEFTPAQIDGSEEKVIQLPMRQQTLTFTGQPFLLMFVLPNAYFHVTTAYGILRHNGVPLGKLDFLGQPQ